jgi:hypothetical protein
VRVGDGGRAKGSLPRFLDERRAVWISRGCRSNTILLRSFERGEATPDGGKNTAERLTSHPKEESDMDTLQALSRLEKTIEVNATYSCRHTACSPACTRCCCTRSAKQ